MLYGILLESCRDGISTVYGIQTWRRIVQELGLGHETFTILGGYEEDLIERIAICKWCFIFLSFLELKEDQSENQPKDRHFPGKKFLLCDLIISLSRSSDNSIKSKIWALFDHISLGSSHIHTFSWIKRIRKIFFRWLNSFFQNAVQRKIKNQTLTNNLLTSRESWWKIAP